MMRNHILLAKQIFLWVLLSTLLACSSSQPIPTRESLSQVKVLFVGNSLTYTNNLPKLVQKQAKQKGYRLKVHMVTLPNYALIDHWKEGKVQELIRNGNFDYVIVQQGPSSQQEGRQMLINDGKSYSELCKAVNSKLCYFMVWPSRTYYHTFDGVMASYTQAASMNDALLLPVGQAWKDHFESTNSFDYYAEDGFHPSLKGSKAAATVIVNTLFKK